MIRALYIRDDTRWNPFAMMNCAGFDVALAASDDDGLALAQRETFDLIIHEPIFPIDYDHLPRVIWFAQRIRQLTGYEFTRIGIIDWWGIARRDTQTGVSRLAELGATVQRKPLLPSTYVRFARALYFHEDPRYVSLTDLGLWSA